MKKFLKIDYLLYLFILIISLLFVADLFMFPGRPANFDSNFHISNIAQFSQILKQGEFPVIWMNNFANYGIPIGIFTHQLTNYLGGTINIFLQNPTLTYNILVFLGIFLTGLFLYFFLRLYFPPWGSFLGIFIFTFTPNHIFNIYVRGAMPEVFSGIFVPLILIALYLIVVRKKIYGYFLLSIFIAGLTLNHPMMLVVYSVFFIPYLFYLLLTNNLEKITQIKILLSTGIFMILGLLATSYYILPLNLEIKYFYYGLIKDHLTGNSFLGLSNFIDPRWYYFTSSEIFPRGHVVKFGLLESLVIGIGFLYAVFTRFISKTKQKQSILYFSLISAAIIIFFNISPSYILFKNLFFLNAIQFPWRFLSALIFIPPIIAAYLYTHFSNKLIFIVIIITVSILSFPQLYGKNFNVYPLESYYFSKVNDHSIMMNTIWTGRSEDYPSKIPQGQIIEGQGKIVSESLSNSSRKYKVKANSDVRMVDHTFYFPGWNVYVDGVNTNIQFQDPKYRGVITYNVPKGTHDVYVVFKDTKVRLLGKALTVFFTLLLAALFVFRKKWSKLVF